MGLGRSLTGIGLERKGCGHTGCRGRVVDIGDWEVAVEVEMGRLILWMPSEAIENRQETAMPGGAAKGESRPRPLQRGQSKNR